jgi:Protein of unknown function (DUF1566)
MDHQLTKLNGFDLLEFDDAMTNYQDARDGSALAAVAWANEKRIGGVDDWVLPSRETLLDLLQLGDSESTQWCWSSSPYVGNTDYAWYVSFGNGGVYYNYRLGPIAVRLVRASQCFDIGLAALHKRFDKVPM